MRQYWGNFLIMKFIYCFSIALTQILRMMGKEAFSVLHFYRICFCLMTNFSGSFHMLLAFQNLVWSSLLWILAFHIYYVILCGKVPLIFVPCILRQYKIFLDRKGDFEGNYFSAGSGTWKNVLDPFDSWEFPNSFMVALLSDLLKFEDWHEWLYFLFSLYIFESIIYLTCCLTIQMFLIFHLLVAQLWTFYVAVELQILKSTMCLWMGIFMRESLFRQWLQEIMGLSISAMEHC